MQSFLPEREGQPKRDMGENIKEVWRGVKKDLKDSFRHIKENIVDPVAGLFGVQEGASQRLASPSPSYSPPP